MCTVYITVIHPLVHRKCSEMALSAQTMQSLIPPVDFGMFCFGTQSFLAVSPFSVWVLLSESPQDSHTS